MNFVYPPVSAIAIFLVAFWATCYIIFNYFWLKD